MQRAGSSGRGAKRKDEDGSAARAPCPTPHALCIVFEVEDTGPGVAPEEMNAIFDPFVQKQSDQASSNGTGLGLSISRKYIRLMGGDITVESNVGQGAVFRFDIRAETAASDEMEAKPSRRVVGLEPGQPAYRILVVEDNAENRIMLSELLRTVGFDVREAENDLEGVAIFEQWRPHLIWMDMRMPVMDGCAATREIRNSKPENRNLPIIALTAHAFEEERRAILAAGCDGIVRKPFKEAEIFDVMERRLAARYIHEDGMEPGAERKERHVENILSREALKEIPGDLLTELEQAIVDLDMVRISAVIDRIRHLNAPVARTLEHLAGNFKYERLLALIENTDL